MKYQLTSNLLKFSSIHNLPLVFLSIHCFILKGTKAEPKNNGKILVHCMAGVSRSPTFVASYLMRDHGMDINEALKIVSDARFIYPNDGFLKLLIKYNRRLGYNR